jgi:hypothetical protein
MKVPARVGETNHKAAVWSDCGRDVTAETGAHGPVVVAVQFQAMPVDGRGLIQAVHHRDLDRLIFCEDQRRTSRLILRRLNSAAVANRTRDALQCARRRCDLASQCAPNRNTSRALTHLPRTQSNVGGRWSVEAMKLTAVAALAVTATVLVMKAERASSELVPVVRSQVLAPPNTIFVSTSLALSQDGRMLAFVAILPPAPLRRCGSKP